MQGIPAWLISLAISALKSKVLTAENLKQWKAELCEKLRELAKSSKDFPYDDEAVEAIVLFLQA